MPVVVLADRLEVLAHPMTSGVLIAAFSLGLLLGVPRFQVGHQYKQCLMWCVHMLDFISIKLTVRQEFDMHVIPVLPKLFECRALLLRDPSMLRCSF